MKKSHGVCDSNQHGRSLGLGQAVVSCGRNRLPLASLWFALSAVGCVATTCATAQEPPGQGDLKEISLIFEQEQVRIAEDIANLKNRIEQLEALATERREAREKVLQFNDFEFIARQVDQARVQDLDDSFLIADFEQTTWAEAFEFLGKKIGEFEFDIKALPDGEVGIPKLPSMPAQTVLEILQSRLLRQGYLLMMTEKRAVLTKFMPVDHSLNGTWEITKAFERGRPEEAIRDYKVVIAENRIMFVEGKGGHAQSFVIGIHKDEFYFFNHDEDWIGNGSFKVWDKQVHILFEFEPPDTDRGEIAGATYYLRLARPKD